MLLPKPGLSAAQVIQTVTDYQQDPTTGAPKTPAQVTWDRGDTGVVNVRHAGAKGDGTTDDTAAIQGLIDSLAATTGGAILFPKGDYRVQTLTLKSGVTLMSGRSQFGYHPSTPSTSVRLRGLSAAGWVIDTPVTQILAAGISGIDVIGATGNTACGGVRLQDAKWCSLSKLHVNGFADQAIVLGAGYATVLEDLLVINALLNRTRTMECGAIEIGGTDQFLSRLEVSTSQTALSDVNMRVNSVLLSAANCFVSHCVGEIGDRGWLVTGDLNRFTGTRGDLNWGHDWEIRGKHNLFSACQAISGGRAAVNTYDGFKITATGLSNRFAACSTVQRAGSTYKYGFEDLSNTGVVNDRNQFAACSGAGWGTSEWSTVGFLGSTPVIPNTPTRPADLTTINVGGSGLISLQAYTVPTTVTAFTNGVNGQEIHLIGGAQAVTIQNNAAIKTNSGADTVVGNGKAIKFILYNAVWYQVS